MRPAPEDVDDLREEIQTWLESKGDNLTQGTYWQAKDDDSVETHPTYQTAYELVLCCGSELSDRLFYGTKGLERSRKQLEEFDEIVARHGFRFDFEDDVTICIVESDSPAELNKPSKPSRWSDHGTCELVSGRPIPATASLQSASAGR